MHIFFRKVIRYIEKVEILDYANAKRRQSFAMLKCSYK